MTKLPTLYKKSSKGQVQEWDISVDGSTITVVHGLQDGKKQNDSKTIKTGKNKGKENETSPEEQALSEAKSKWKKQLDKGYVESLDEVDTDVYLPMLAQTYSKMEKGVEKGRKKYIKFPCFAQRKFDGVRSLSSVDKHGNVHIISRKGKEFPNLEHLNNDIKKITDGFNIVIDGELYSDELSFQRLVGLVKRQTLSTEDLEDMKKVKIRVYDCINKDYLDMPFIDRHAFISERISEVDSKMLTIVENFNVDNEDDINRLHNQFVQEGFEGIILRNIRGKYELNKRSNDLQKYKYFVDSEYKIVGFEEGTGRAEGTVIWICEQPDTKSTFKVRPRGTDEERKNWFINGDSYVGQMLTVRYQELTEDEKVPRFPVGITVRSYE